MISIPAMVSSPSRLVLSSVFEVRPQFRIAERCDSDFALRRLAQATSPKQRSPRHVKAHFPNYSMKLDPDPAILRTRTALAEDSASPFQNSLKLPLSESAPQLSQFPSKY